MSISLSAKAARFAALHQQPGAFVIPNPWDGGSARLLEARGFSALATSSAACAAALGRRDYGVTRDEALYHARVIAAAADLPVSADLENGFGTTTATVAETIRLAAAAGLVGGSIEDSTGDDGQPLFTLEFAAERVAAAVAAARSLDFPFVLTARTENLVHGVGDLAETIRRLQAYERAGADVLFAPGLRAIEDIRAVCAAVRKPVNFIGGFAGATFTMAELAAAGVKRVSLAASLYRAALTGVDAAACELRDAGTFTYANRILQSREVEPWLR
ncbi:MAG: 2-methylisocitrate lyase [Opitutus sp.]|nr:2-methylisocitrate lyase [Opitutus sp.]